MTGADKHQLRPLLERALAPDPDPAALNEFFGRLRPYLHGVVRKVLGHSAQGPLDHSNLVQSSLRRIFEHFDDVRAGGVSVPRLLGWVERIVRNRIIDELRRRHPAGPIDHEVLTDPGMPPPRSGRQVLHLLAALDRLPERQRLVVELHWFDRLPDAEIARRLGGSVGAIKVLRCRALKHLRRQMEASHDDQ
jgi:RNA polymerase sigma factor (sigma-70 family)